MDPNNQHYRSTRPGIKICEAVDCSETATETIIVPIGKFGTINLNLCHKCAVTKFQTTPSRDTILKTPLNQPVEDYSHKDYCCSDPEEGKKVK